MNNQQIISAVFRDCDSSRSGRQPLGLNRAALITQQKKTWLLANDSVAGRSPNDLFIEIDGIVGMDILGVSHG